MNSSMYVSDEFKFFATRTFVPDNVRPLSSECADLSKQLYLYKIGTLGIQVKLDLGFCAYKFARKEGETPHFLTFKFRFCTNVFVKKKKSDEIRDMLFERIKAHFDYEVGLRDIKLVE